MSYDIIEWLTESAPPGPLGRRMVEAAEEIARLRAENTDLQRKVGALRSAIRQLVPGQPDETDEP